MVAVVAVVASYDWGAIFTIPRRCSFIDSTSGRLPSRRPAGLSPAEICAGKRFGLTIAHRIVGAMGFNIDSEVSGHLCILYEIRSPCGACGVVRSLLEASLRLDLF